MVVKVEVFTSDSCPHCPAAVNVANEAKEVLGDAADIIVCNIASEEKSNWPWNYGCSYNSY